MRGQTQAHLLMADDGRAYVVKFSNNPQHSRILVNELLASALLAQLRISVPEAGIIRITDGFLNENPSVYLQLCTERYAVMIGLHFGSCYPGDPNQVSVYDFLPDTMLRRVVNPADFLGVLVVDKWTSNPDARQAIFFRAPPEQSDRCIYTEICGACSLTNI
jgi:hypothetical protein